MPEKLSIIKSAREALRCSYLEAYRNANSGAVPTLYYENGWWLFRSPGGFSTTRYRTSKLLEMRNVLEAKAGVRLNERDALTGTRAAGVNREVTPGRLSPQHPEHIVTITRLGEPVAWARTRGKHRYTPKPQRSAADELRLEATRAMAGRPPLEGALQIEVLAVFGIPETWSQQRRAAAAGQPVTKRPDADNILKLLKDSFGAPAARGGRGKQLHPGIVYKDDAQISHACIRKRYGTQPKLVITIMADDPTRTFPPEPPTNHD